MKLKSIAAALVAVTAVGASFSANANEVSKHFGFRTAPVVRYVAPAPVVVNRYVAPVRYGYGHGHSHGGYWSNGRWIAPVVIGAALLGTIAAANTFYAPAPVTYVSPAPTYYSAPVAYAAPPVVYANPPVVVSNASVAPANCDTFCQADRDRNGVIDKIEASFDPVWEKWFYDIDRNNDGVITRQELNDWNRNRPANRPY